MYATDYLALMSAITAALKAEREMREAWALLAPVMYNTYGCRNGAKAASETLNRLLGGE